MDQALNTVFEDREIRVINLPTIQQGDNVIILPPLRRGALILSSENPFTDLAVVDTEAQTPSVAIDNIVTTENKSFLCFSFCNISLLV